MMDEIGYLIQANDEAKQAYQYPVSQDYLIGSSVECNLKIADEDILGLHCRIRVVNDEVCIFSLSSQNPVFVNKEPVSEEGKTLKDEDEIRINDDHKFEWKTATNRRIFSRSLPLENEPSLEVKARYSDSALITWKNVDRVPEECTDFAPRNSPIQEDDEPVSEEETLSKTVSVEKSNVSIPREVTLSSVEYGNKSKCSVSTPVKSRKSLNPVSPFTTNTSASNSKNDTSKISHQNDNNEAELECSARNIPEDLFEDLIMPQPGSQKPFHSTPKTTTESKNRKIARSSSSSLVDVNFEKDVEIDTSELTVNCDVTEKTDAVSEKSMCNETKKGNSVSKKCAITPTKRASEGNTESRRNTRGRTSLLRKTFEENSCDNEVKFLTTPEKLTEASNITQTSFVVDSETENVADSNAEYKSLNESSKAGFASVSDENDTCEASFIDKYKMCNVVKNVSASKPGLVAKCARNLSYISPPENNRSQEYMDSMVTTTPQKNSPSLRESITENFNVMTPSFLCNTKDSSFDDSMNTSLSSARKRRSTGFTPFVGTPSNEYRVTRKMSTPFSRSVLSRTSVDFDGASRDSKQSFERRSTPYKLPSGKSSMRDSISCQPTIQESVSFEELEAGNHEYDSINDPKFRFITKRRKQRYGENTFAEEDRILEESEIKSDCTELDNDCSLEEEHTAASVTNASISSDNCDELSNDDGTVTETAKNAVELKSILTPLPKSLAFKEKSAKRVTFVLPNSSECTMNKEDSTLSVDESFAMISSSRTTANDEQSFNYNSVISDEELHASDRQETDLSYNSVSEPEASSVTNSITEKCNESSLNISGLQSQTKIQSNLNDLSGVEQIQSPEPSPEKYNLSETDNDVFETNAKADTLNETPKHSSFNVTDVESSLVSLEPLNRSNLGEEECTETSIEVTSLKEITETTVTKNLNDSCSAKISCSPGIHLSGVKTLLKTPEKSRRSSVSQGAKLKCILNFKANSSSKTNAPNETNMKSASARKSVEVNRKTAAVPSSRMCKSLNMNEIMLKSKPLSAEEIQIEQSRVTIEVAEKEIAAENVHIKDSASVEEIIEIDSANESSIANKVPEIVVTEATFIDQNENDETLELTNETQEEAVIECPKVETPKKVQFDDNESKSETSNCEEKESVENPKLESPNKVQFDDESKFETSDHEEEINSDNDETVSSGGSVTEDIGSPVITQIRRSAVSNIQLDSKTPSSESKTKPEVNKSLTTINLKENEIENDPNSDVSCNTSSMDTYESTAEAANESQSSLEVIVSDRDNSRLCDALSPENINDANFSKTSINESSCDNSQSYDSSAKDTSDFDTSKTSMNESSCNKSQISDSFLTDSNDFDTRKNNVVATNLDNSVMGDLLFKEANHVDVSENNVSRKNKILECLSAETEMQSNISENTRKLDEIEDILDTNVANVSQSTSSSQETGIRIDASSGLINDLHKELESTPYPSNPSSSEATPAEFFIPISFPESSNMSRIECAVSNPPENFSKPDLPPEIKINDGFFTPLKTALRESSTPRSSVIRCRKSLRIHKCNPDDTSNKSCTSLHDCSIISNDSQTQDNAENIKNPREIYNQVLDELNIKLVGVKEKVDAVQESFSTKENTAEEVSEPVLYSDSTQIIDSVSSAIPSTESPTEEITISINSPDLLTTNDEQLEHSSEDDLVENASTDTKELSDVHEVTADISKAPTVENSEQIENLSTPVVTIEDVKNVSTVPATNENEDSKKTNDLSVDTVPDKRRSLRTRREHSVAPVVDISEQEVVIKTRQRGRPTLWYKKHFHCYLCFNSPAVFSKKCVRKTKMKPVEEDLNEAHDDKENVCSLLKVIDNPKKIELSTEQITAEEPTVTEKKTRKPQRLKNVENIATEAESQQNVEEVGKRSCSIVLTPLDPEIIKSPVKVDESNNISPVKTPPAATKRKRIAKAANKIEQNPAPTTSRTRQKQVKAVTFDIAQRKSDEVTQQTEENDAQSKAISSKRNLRSKASSVKPAAAAKSKKTKINENEVETIETKKSYEIGRTIKIQLEPVDESITSPTEPVDKRTRAKRGIATTIKTQKPEKEAKETKTKTPRAAKRSPENVEEDAVELPKRRRVKAKVNDEISSKENTKSGNTNETVKELPKKTRARAKTNVQVETETPVSSLGKSTRATRNKLSENVTSHSGTGAKKRARDVTESSTQNNSEKSNKKTRIVKSVELHEPVESTTVKKSTKKLNSAKEVSTHSIPSEEPVASTSQKIPTPRVTRSRKTEIVKSKKITPVKNATKVTRATKKKTAPASEPCVTIDEDTPVNSKRTRNVKKSPPEEKVPTKRAVVTRAKKLTIQKGRISSTLKTTGRGSLVVRKSAKAAPEEKPVTSNLRRTRRRAN